MCRHVNAVLDAKSAADAAASEASAEAAAAKVAEAATAPAAAAAKASSTLPLKRKAAAVLGPASKRQCSAAGSGAAPLAAPPQSASERYIVGAKDILSRLLSTCFHLHTHAFNIVLRAAF